MSQIEISENIMATIKEIADLAGVSRGTVDRVLNNRGAVSEKTAQKILEIAQALDYKPNRAGLTLAAQKKKLKLGVVLFSTENPFFEEVCQGVREQAEKLLGYGCTVLIREISFEAGTQLAAIDELLAEDINGLAISPTNDSLVRCRIDSLTAQGIPVVTFNTDIQNSTRLAYVGSDFMHCGETAAGLMRLMIQKPAHVGIITGSDEVLCHTERIAGFERAVAQENIPLKIVFQVRNHDDDFESYEKTLKMLKAHPETDALFFAAGGVYGGCRAVKALKLEKKLLIIAFDAVPTTRVLIAEGMIAATICQHPRLQGSKPLEILFHYLASGELPEQEYLYMPVDIRIRENL